MPLSLFTNVVHLAAEIPKDVAYSVEQVLLNKRQIYGGAPKVNCYRHFNCTTLFNARRI